MKKKNAGALFLLGAAFIWGTALVAQRVGMDFMGAFTFNTARFIIGSITLLPLVFWNKRKYEKFGKKRGSFFNWPELLRGSLLCGLILFAAVSLQQVGILYTSVGKTGFISALYIIIVPLLGIAYGREVKLLIWVCVGLATGGMYFLCIHGSFVLGKGDVYIFLCAVLTAFYIMLIDHYVLLVDGVVLSLLQFIFCAFLSSIVAISTENIDISAMYAAWGPLLYAGVLSSGVAYTLQVAGQKEVSPPVTSLLLSFESVFAVAAGWLVLGEILTIREVTGCVLLFFAIILAQSPDIVFYQRHPRHKP